MRRWLSRAGGLRTVLPWNFQVAPGTARLTRAVRRRSCRPRRSAPFSPRTHPPSVHPLEGGMRAMHRRRAIGQGKAMWRGDAAHTPRWLIRLPARTAEAIAGNRARSRSQRLSGVPDVELAHRRVRLQQPSIAALRRGGAVQLTGGRTTTTRAMRWSGSTAGWRAGSDSSGRASSGCRRRTCAAPWQ